MADCLLSQGVHLLGVLSLSYLVLKQSWKLLKGFGNHILSRWWRTDLKKYGGWAVVTGATDGIGKAYAEELARRGLNVVLISRTLKKLQSVAEGLELQPGRKTKIIQVDFTGGPEIYPKIEEGLKGLDIGILVNNVGMVYGNSVSKFLDVPDVNQSLTNIINCNILTVVHMTRLVLPQMVSRKKGLIINISSEAGYSPLPLVTVYSATKAFVDFFSRGVHAEYKSDGITVQSVLPLLVSTPMIHSMEDTIIVKKAEDFAREALNTVGYTTRTSGCLSHSIQRVTDVINCNILSVVHMTRLVLPQMVSRKKGLIINISSEAGYNPLPLVTVYSATKAFVDFFSRGVHAEYKSDGITVQSVLPLFVSTPMNFSIEDSITVKKAEDFAREALNTVGYTTRTSGCLSHSIQSYVLEHFLSRSVSSFPLLVNFGIKFSKLTGKSKKQ
ncbi:very-long-chain 3-oxoacyl-CoA reductase-B-like isoform X2 [Pseudophryne corroboree]|uniref:very-long-chain 3-oxoacyl-CoA reductase-B-like isoform X2 n=1 Tax=Pseudophryne corroboree TaxID=495146 RepID=UPI0030819B91